MKKGTIFNQVEQTRPRSNSFDLSHDRKFSSKFGQLTPIMALDCVPGDKINIKPSAMVRMAPLIAPVMHKINVFVHYFFVPNRIVWPGRKQWEDFITGGEDGLDLTVWSHADYKPDDYQAGSLPDYMGLPIASDVIATTGQDAQVSTLPFAAYQKIYNDYYRDQNLQAPVLDEVNAGLINPGLFTDLTTLRTRAWQHDYFTSTLPWTQKGPEAMLPLGNTAPLLYNEDGLHVKSEAWIGSTGANTPPSLASNIEMDAAILNQVNSAIDGAPISLDVSGAHVADLSAATSSSINDLRRAITLQVWLEKNARGGSRYTESINVHFGVRSSDQRLQRPEYIGGLKTPIKVSEILNTSGSTDNPSASYQPQGTMAGHGISVGGAKSFTYRAEEHGYIIGIMSVMPVTSYQQGIPRHFSRADKFDYYWPEFANLGEQAVMNQELAWSGDVAYNAGVFGYTPRYAEYKYMSNTVHGDFKTTLDFWHLGRKFSALPNLNSDFIEMDSDEVERIFAVQSANDQSLWCQVYNEVHARRLMPIFGTPKTM